jgi:AP-4 complex subunit epsilon-1
MVTEETTADLLRAKAIALRLRESEEDSCLWRLRCADALLGTKMQVMLNT